MGATVPESFGLYFSWGNTNGHPRGGGYDFSQAVYDTTPAAAINTNLSLNEDAARANLGAPWRMPTAEEFQELFDNCTNVWTTQNGVYGRLFTSNVNGNSLFFPAAGYYNGTSFSYPGTYGFYFSSTYFSVEDARGLRFDSSVVSLDFRGHRRNGLCVRAVQEGTPNRSIVRPTSVSEPTEEETPTTEEPRDDNQR